MKKRRFIILTRKIRATTKWASTGKFFSSAEKAVKHARRMERDDNRIDRQYKAMEYLGHRKYREVQP